MYDLKRGLAFNNSCKYFKNILKGYLEYKPNVMSLIEIQHKGKSICYLVKVGYRDQSIISSHKVKKKYSVNLSFILHVLQLIYRFVFTD